MFRGHRWDSNPSDTVQVWHARHYTTWPIICFSRWAITVLVELIHFFTLFLRGLTPAPTGDWHCTLCIVDETRTRICLHPECSRSANYRTTIYVSKKKSHTIFFGLCEMSVSTLCFCNGSLFFLLLVSYYLLSFESDIHTLSCPSCSQK